MCHSQIERIERNLNDCVIISKKLNSIFEPEPIELSASKQIIHCKIPYISNFYDKQFNYEVLHLVSICFPQVNLLLIFVKSNTVQSFLNKYEIPKYKDEIPESMNINIMYIYIRV